MTVLDSGSCHYRQVMLLVIQEGQAGILLDEFIRREALFIFITPAFKVEPTLRGYFTPFYRLYESNQFK